MEELRTPLHLIFLSLSDGWTEDIFGSQPYDGYTGDILMSHHPAAF